MHTMKARLLAPIILAAFFAAWPAGNNASSQETPPVIRAEVALVNVVFTATDKKGIPLRDLKADDFQVFEDRVPQKIEYFSELKEGSEVPLTIALLIDTSGSVKEKLDYEKTTAAEFFKEILRPNKDLALIIQFDSEVNLVQDFTQSQEALLSALDGLRAGNSTSLYDAVYLAAEEKLKEEIGRKVMVVITDGEDTASKVRKEEAIEAAQRSDALIYGIGVRSEGYQHNFGVLEKFAEETGGAFFSPHAKLEEIRAAFRAIGEDIRGQYSLAYRSTNEKKDGTFRRIDLRCKVRGVQIRARRGYYAPKPPSALFPLQPTNRQSILCRPNTCWRMKTNTYFSE
jgi:VWFA-related protein